MIASAQPDTEFVTITEAAKRLGRNPATIRKWISKGILPTRRRIRDGYTLVSMAVAEALLTASVPSEKE